VVQDIDGDVISRLDCVKFLTDQQVADAHRKEHRIVFAMMIGLAWTNEAEAGRAVLRPLGHEARYVIGRGPGH